MKTLNTITIVMMVLSQFFVLAVFSHMSDEEIIKAKEEILASRFKPIDYHELEQSIQKWSNPDSIIGYDKMFAIGKRAGLEEARDILKYYNK